MKQVKLGATNKEVSAVALGIMRMVRLDTDQAANILNTVHEQGVNFIDGADIYGNGESEKIFGQALKKSGLKRDDLLYSYMEAIQCRK